MHMSGRTFVDTNILVYALDDGEPRKRDLARRVLSSIDPSRLSVSTQVLAEFYVVATRKLAAPLSEADAAQAVESLLQLSTVNTDVGLVSAAIATSRAAQLSLWDALIIEAAALAGCDRLLSEDLSHGVKIGAVRIENPFLAAA